MTTFAAPASTLESRAPDASKHVHYSLGMVLGVDDFNQEFAYLSGRDRWLARDAIGYGTLSGLRVLSDSGTKGPRITVKSGSALTPRGQLVCVKPDQCAYLNDWLAANESTVDELLGNVSPSMIELYLTLCYRDCAVDLVPIPGPPCRSEGELMAPSRLADSFTLELRTTPPKQQEEDLLREFVELLDALPFGGGGPYATIEEFEEALREAVQVVTSSPDSEPAEVHLAFGSPMLGMQLDPALASDYYRAALHVWIEDIRPHVHAICGCGSGCCGGKNDAPPKADECVLLARLEVPVVHTSGNWLVDDTGTVRIDESRRPMLGHLRLLQEWIYRKSSAPAPAPEPPPAPVMQIRTVAAGIVGADGTQEQPNIGNLIATAGSGALTVTFDDYAQPDGSFQYLVSAMPFSKNAPADTVVMQDSMGASGIELRVNGTGLDDATLETMYFAIEVKRIGQE